LNTKTLTIGGAIVLLLTTWISRVTGLVTDNQLLFAFFALLAVTASAAFSYIISWATTDGYKKYHWPPNRWREQVIKRKIFKCAWWSAGIPMAVFGASILLWSLTGKMLLIGSVVWSILAVLVAVTSPGLRDFVVDSLIPRLKRWAKGKNEIGHEALDRPSEVPRE
jgi:hypothetical protein